MRYRFITFLSDYGAASEFPGICRGVAKRLAPDAEIIDVTHGIEPQDVTAGALVLAAAVPYLPEAVHVAIVDPGVGTDREAVAIVTGTGSVLVGPDNGLLWPAAEALGGAAGAFAIESPRVLLQPVSATFHGRDVFMPAAAHLALGMEPSSLGHSVPVDRLARLEIPAPKVEGSHLHGRVLMVDRFGNLQLNASPADLERIGVREGDAVRVALAGEEHPARYCRTFAEVLEGEIALLADSTGRIAVAVNHGSASARLGATRDDAVTLRLAARGGAV